MYDIYLLTECRVLPELEDLKQHIPAVADPAFRVKILTPSPRGPGFLGFDLTKKDAAELFQRLKSARAVGFRLPSAYRQPRISVEQARVIAEPAIVKQRARRPGHTLGSICLIRDRPMCWTFGALWEPPVMIEGGGMAYASVDKLDGHIWTIAEFDRLGEEEVIDEDL